MKIGTSMRADWLDRPDDLRYLKQIGVDCVDIVTVAGWSKSRRAAIHTHCFSSRHNLWINI